MKHFALVLLLLLAGAALEAFGQTNPNQSGTPVFGNVQSRSTVNSSVVITTGNTFQTILTASSSRVSLTIENNNASDSCSIFIGSGTATAAKSILLLAGGSYTRYWPYVPSDVIQATCASNSDTLYVDSQ